MTVAECLSFTKAADKLFISQPTLSRQVWDLEQLLGIKLIDRTTRKVRLTETGKKFYTEAKAIVDRLDALMANYKAAESSSGGSLSVGYLETVPQKLISFALNRFIKANPSAKVQFSRMGHLDVIEAIKKRVLDIGFCIDLGSIKFERGMKYKELISNPVQLLVNNDHPLAAKESVSVKDMAGEQFITCTRSTVPQLRDILDSVCEQSGCALNITQEIITPGAIPFFVESGVGVSLVSSFILNVYPEKSRLKLIDIDDYHENIILYLVWSEDNDNSLLESYCDEVVRATHAMDK